MVNRIPLELDEQGWSDVVKLLNDTLEAALRIQADSQKRQGKPGAEDNAIRTELGVLHFRHASST